MSSPGQATRAHPSHGAPTRPRLDIQGLRMVAIVAVIADHLFHWPSGGFVGVDVFFVISGFLITGLLLREIDRTGTISFWGFYRRRIKRIMPAAVAVVIVTVIAARLLFSPARFDQTLHDGIWSIFFVANWNFVAQGTDYFNAEAAVSPLQHFWSLAVEEQFYFVWPWAILLIFWLIGRRAVEARRRRVGHVVVLVAIVLLSLASLAWAAAETPTAPTTAYFSTLTRAWELGVGAILAVAATSIARIPPRARPVLAWIGLLGIAVSLVLIDESKGFPFPSVILPVLSTALVIVAGTGEEQRFLWPLTNRISRYIGDISYSLYLWHWPIIIFLEPFFPSGSKRYLAVALVAMTCISIASYHLLEDPIRRSSWLQRRRVRPTRLETVPSTRKRTTLIGIACLAVSIVGTPVVVAVTGSPDAGSVRIDINVADYEDPDGVVGERKLAIAEALTAEEWPDLEPAVEQYSDQLPYVDEWSKDKCLEVDDSKLDQCAYGPVDAELTIAVLGDSHAISYMPMLRAAHPNARIQLLTMGQCPTADVDVTTWSGEAFPKCAKHRSWAFEWVRNHSPDRIVTTDAITTVKRIADSDGSRSSLRAYRAALATTFPILTEAVNEILVLPSPPTGENLVNCKTPTSTPADCATSVTDEYTAWTNGIKGAIEDSHVADHVTYIPTQEWFCLNDTCPAFTESTPFFADGGHLTTAGSSALAPLFLNALR